MRLLLEVAKICVVLLVQLIARRVINIYQNTWQARPVEVAIVLVEERLAAATD